MTTKAIKTLLLPIRVATAAIGLAFLTSGCMKLEKMGAKDITEMLAKYTESNPDEVFKLAKVFPSDEVVRVPAEGQREFFAIPTITLGSKFSYELNGQLLPDQQTAIISISGDALLEGQENTLKVTIDAPKLKQTLTHTFRIVKNRKPILSNPSPLLTGTMPLAGNGLANFQAIVSDPDGDPLTAEWTIGDSSSDTLTGTFAGGLARGIFQPASQLNGEKTVRLSIDDGLDTSVYDWAINILPPVTIISFTPTASPVLIGSTGITTFGINADGAVGAIYKWELDGVEQTGRTDNFFELNNVTLGGGAHSLKVTVSNQGGSDDHTFLLRKNSPPYIQSKVPTNNTGNTAAIGAATNFSVTALDPDNDVLTYVWRLNQTTIAGATTALYPFTPDVSQVGPNTLTVFISDGKDQIEQNWTVIVESPVTITSTQPSPDGNGIVWVKNSGNTTFQVTTSGGSGVTYEWYINNVKQNGQTNSSFVLAGSSLTLNTTHSIRVKALSGTMAPAEHTYSVRRNQMPTIGSLNPPASGNLVCRLCSLDLSGTGSDSDAGQTLSWSWKLDAADAPAAFLGSGGTRSYRPIDTAAQLSAAPGGTIDHLITATLSDGVDEVTTAWSVSVFDSIQITSFFPNVSSPTELVFPTNSTQFFSVSPSLNGDISYSYVLAGPGQSGSEIGTNNMTSLTYAQLPGAPGATSTLTATVTMGGSTATKVFNLRKNAPPEILATTPVATGTTVPYTVSLPITVNARDIDGHTLTYTWTVTNPNGPVNPADVLTGFNAADNRTVTYQPRAQDVGTNTIRVVASDGYDTFEHSWLINIAAPILISSWSPTGNPVKIGAGATRVFSVNLQGGATPSAYEWKLCPVAQTSGGIANCTTPMRIGTEAYFGLSGSELPTDGAEYLLTVNLSAPSGNDSHTFNIKKNRPLTITPTAPVDGNGVPKQFDNQITFSASTPLAFSANVADPDLEDSVASCNWLMDSSSSAFLVAGTFNAANSTSASANFSPASSIQGYRNITLRCTDNYDEINYTWQAQVIAPISILSFSPTDSLTIFGSNTVRTFSVTPNMNAGVTYQYKINDGAYGPTPPSSSNFVVLSAANLPINGDNQLTLKAMGGGGEATRTFMLRKNVAPSVIAPSPSGPITIPYTNSDQQFWITPVDVNGDTITVNWKMNGQSSAKLQPISSADNAIYGRQSGERGARFSGLTIADASAHVITAELSDGYDTSSHNWAVTVIAPATIESVNPNAPIRIGSASPSIFSVTTVGSGGATFTWAINGGSNLAGQTSNFLSLLGTSLPNLNPTPNTVRVNVIPSQGDPDFHDFTVFRNRPPVISSLDATLTGGSGTVVAYNAGTLDLVANATDADSDTLTYTWKIGGTTPPGLFESQNASGSQVRFTPTAAWKGARTITVDVSDGYDVVTSTRNITIIDPITFSSWTPLGVTVLGASSVQSFTVTPNAASGVSHSYVINPETAAVNRSETTSFIELRGSDFATSGIHTLRAIASAGGSTTSRDFSIRKNQPPVISGTSSETVPQSLSVTVPRTFMDPDGNNRYYFGAGVNDGDDPAGSLTYTWRYNGQTGSPLISSGNTAYVNLAASTVGSHTVSVTVTDGYDTATRTWALTIVDPVLISSWLPSDNVRIPFSGSQTLSVIVGSGSSPTYAWYLGASPPSTCAASRNGTNLNSPTSSVAISGSQIGGTSTAYVAVDANSTCDFKAFSLTKNSRAVVASATPEAAGTLVAMNGSVTFEARVTDANSDALSYSWFFDGNASSVSLTDATPTGTNTVARTYTPQAGHADNGGGHTVRLDVNDGYDITSYFWAFNVRAAVQITSTTPADRDGSNNPINYVFGANTSNLFRVNTSYTEGVTFSWRLNGNVISGETANSILVNGGMLSPGTNTLEGRAAAGGSFDSRTFYLVKNEPPNIVAWTSVANEVNTSYPRPTGFSMAYIATREFHVRATDSHALTYVWKLNGVVPTGSVFTGTGATRIFNPPDGVTGLQTVTAEVSDPYDTSTYSWGVEVLAPVEITGFVPPGNPVVFGANTSFTFAANANSTSGVSYSYALNSVARAETTPYLVLSGSDLSAGTHTLVATISNNGSSDSHTFNLRKNTPPTPSNASPDINLSLGNSNTFSVQASDIDNDAITVQWSINGSTTLGSVFTDLTTNTAAGVTTTSITFTPTVAWVGTQRLRATFGDGYETNFKEWVFPVTNPTIAQITASSPPGCETNAPVAVAVNSTAATQTFTVSNTGKDPTTYEWRLDGQAVGTNSSLLNLDMSLITAANGRANLTVTVADADSQDDCTFQVKRNILPVLSAVTPTLATPVRIAYDTTWPDPAGKLFSVTATDANSDAITSNRYTWYFDGNPASQRISVLTNGNQAYFNPGGDSNLTLSNPHTVSVKVSDGQEDSTLMTWTVHVNAFSDKCNELAPGNICTLVGDPDIGHGQILTEQTRSRFKMAPNRIIDDGAGNLYISDLGSHVVWFYSKNGSSGNTWFGRVWSAGQLAIILGNGAAGNVTSALSGTSFKLNNPAGMAWDDNNKNLYVADYSNHRIVRINRTNNFAEQVIGGGSNNNAGQSTNWNAANAAFCGHPLALTITQTASTGAVPDRSLFFTCGNWSCGAGVTGCANGTFASIKQYALEGTNSGLVRTFQTSTSTWVPGLKSDLSGNLYWAEYNNQRVMARNNMAAGNNLVLGNITIAPSTTPSQLFSTWATALNCTATNGNNTLTGCGATTNVSVGMTISNTHIPYLATVTAKTANTITMSANATGTGGTTPFFSSNPHFVPFSNGWPVEIELFSDREAGSNTVDGIFYSVVNNASIYFWNARNTGGPSYRFGGSNLIPPAASSRVAGLDSSQGFNGNGAAAITRQLWNNNSQLQSGFTLSTARGTSTSDPRQDLMIGDTNNWRVRTVDLSSSKEATLVNPGNIAAFIGAGIAKTGKSESAMARDTLTSGPMYISIDPLRNMLYFTDTGNSLTRRVDLMSGWASVGPGRAINPANALENQVERTLASQQSPRGLAFTPFTTNRSLTLTSGSTTATGTGLSSVLSPGMLVSGTGIQSGTLIVSITGTGGTSVTLSKAATATGAQNLLFASNHLVYADRGGTNCHARVVNLDNVSRPLLGTSSEVAADSVFTVMGRTDGTGCNFYNGAEGGSATTPRFWNPEGIAVDARRNVYLADESSHVVLQLVGDPNSPNYGKIYTLIGLSNTAGSAIGSGSTATGSGNTTRLNAPAGIAVDPRNPGSATEDGNLFIADRGNGRVLYINRKTVAINQDASSGNGDLEALPAHSSAVGSVTVLSSWNPGGGVRGLAAYGNQICFATQSFHNVQCYSRTNLNSHSLLIGPGGTGAENSGGTFSVEGEGVSASSSRMWNPTGISFDPEGNLYIVDQSNHMIRKVARWPAVQD